MGIRVIIKELPLTEFNEKAFQRDFDVLGVYISGGMELVNSRRLWRSSQIDQGFNVFSYRNPKIDQILDKGKKYVSREEYRDDFSIFTEE